MIENLSKIKELSANWYNKCSDTLKNTDVTAKVSTKIRDVSKYISYQTEKNSKKAINSLKGAQQFVKNNVQSVNMTINDFCQPLSHANISSNNKVIWFCFMIFLWFSLNCAYFYIEYLKSISFFNIIGLLLAVVSLILVLILFYILYNDFLGIITVSNQLKNKEYIRKLLQNDNVEKLREYLLNEAVIEKSNRAFLSEKLVNAKTSIDLLIIYEEIELKEPDKRVNAIINKYSLIASAAAIKDGFFNFVIMSIVFSKMLIDIAKEYKIRLGICSFVNVMMLGLIGSSISSVLSKVIGATFKQIPYLNVIVEIGTPIAIMKALGCKVKYAIRPIEPFSKKMLNTTIKEIGKEGEK